MSSISISRLHHASQFQSLFTNRCKCPRIAVSLTMTMNTEFSPPMIKSKKKEGSLQLSSPMLPISRVETLRFCDLNFDRLQPSDDELEQHSKFEFGQFVAREALLDEEYWASSWLRAETQWENQANERCVDSVDPYRRRTADKEFELIRRRYKMPNWEKYACIITVRKENKNEKLNVIKSVVGTVDLSIRYLLHGETFPGECPPKISFFSTNRTPSSRYGYIANLCVAKYARRRGIATNMVHFAVEFAKSNGVERVYMHVDRKNSAARRLYENLGFEVVEKTVSLSKDHAYSLLCLQV